MIANSKANFLSLVKKTNRDKMARCSPKFNAMKKNLPSNKQNNDQKSEKNISCLNFFIKEWTPL